MMTSSYVQYLHYIKHTGQGEPVYTDWFDGDWSPLGPGVRNDLVRKGLATESNGKISLIQLGLQAIE